MPRRRRRRGACSAGRRRSRSKRASKRPWRGIASISARANAGIERAWASEQPLPVVILCGGAGRGSPSRRKCGRSRCVEIGGRPIVWHIMKHYSRYGFNEFVLALGYKGEQIKRYFLDYHAVGHDMTMSLHDGRVAPIDTTVRAVDGASHRHRRSDADGGRLRQLAP